MSRDGLTSTPTQAADSAIDATTTEAVVIIGSGAGGGTVAYELTTQGIPCVVLEAGPFLTPDDYENDEWARSARWPGWTSGPRPAAGGSRATSPTCRPGSSRRSAARPRTGPARRPRFLAHEFKAKTYYGDIDGREPARLADHAGRPRAVLRPGREGDRLHATATAARRCRRTTTTRCSPTAPSGSATTTTRPGPTARTPSRTTAAPPSSRTASTSRATRTAPSGPPRSARSRGHSRPASSTCGRSARRCRSPTTPPARSTRVDLPRRRGNLHRQAAKVVCVAGNSIETPRLLLMSASSLHPDGLANSSGQVGRNYMRHTDRLGVRPFEQPVHMYRGETMAGIIADEARTTPRAASPAATTWRRCRSVRPSWRLRRPRRVGPRVHRVMDAYENMAGMWIVGEDMPQETQPDHPEQRREGPVGAAGADVTSTTTRTTSPCASTAYGAADPIYGAVGALAVTTPRRTPRRTTSAPAG